MFAIGLEGYNIEGDQKALFHNQTSFGPFTDLADGLAGLFEQLIDTKEKWQRTTSKIRLRLTKEPRELQSRVSKRLALIKARLEEPLVVQLRDKVSFFMGVSNLCLTIWILSARPHWIPAAYAVQSAALIPLRFWLYYRKAWHYFTFDLCYFVNCLVLISLFVAPSSKSLVNAAFMLAHGPVVWAVVQWRNSLVFHSLDKITSCLIHMAPCVVMYAVRWGLPSEYQATRFAGFSGASIGFWPSLFSATVYYSIWQLAYYLMVDVIKKDKVHSGERVTSFTWIATQAESQRDWRWSALNALGQRRRLVMFMTLQFTYAVVTMLPTMLLWKYQWLHTAVLLLMFSTTVWNGATYYVEVFGNSLVEKLRTIQQEMADSYPETTEPEYDKASDKDSPTHAGTPTN